MNDPQSIQAMACTISFLYFVSIHGFIASAFYSVPRKFSPGHLGGVCGKAPEECVVRPISLVCTGGICSCEIFSAPYFIAGNVGCYGLNESVCNPGNIILPKYLTSVADWEAEYKRVTDKAKAGTLTGTDEDQLLQLDVILKAGMGGKRIEDWSCRSGTCKDERCTDGINPALLPLDVPEHAPVKAQKKSGEAKMLTNISVKVMCLSATLILGLKF